MKKFKLFSIALTALLGIGLVSCNEKEVAPESISITSEGNQTELEVNKTLQLTAKVSPDKAEQGVVWSVSLGSTKASVSPTGLVSGLSEGNVMITAVSTYDASITKDFALTIIEESEPVINPESIVITGESTVRAAETITLAATVKPSGAPQGVVWSSADTEIATISDAGVVNGLSVGKVTITAASTANKDITQIHEVTVTEAPSQDDWVDMPYSTYDEYHNALDDVKLKIKGTVTLVIPGKDDLVSYYIQNGSEGYYVYNQDGAKYPVTVGESYTVGGYKLNYKETGYEIVNIEYFVKEDAAVSYIKTDASKIDLTMQSNINKHKSSYITMSELTITKAPSVNTTKAFTINAEKADGYALTVSIDPKNMPEADFTALCDLFSPMIVGSKFQAGGVLAFDSKPTSAVKIVAANDDDFASVKLTDEEAIEAIKDNLSVVNSVPLDVLTIELAESFVLVPEAVISWVSDSEAINVTTKAVTHGAVDVIVKLTATISVNAESDSKEFVVNVFGTYEVGLTTVYSLDCEDALPNEGGFSKTSPTKSGYTPEADVVLGSPEAKTWMMRSALIGADTGDVTRQGDWAIRLRRNDDIDASGRLELKTATDFNAIQFDVARFGNDAGADLRISYSSNGTDWTHYENIIAVDNAQVAQTVRVHLNVTGSIYVALTVLATRGDRVSLDNLSLLKVAS